MGPFGSFGRRRPRLPMPPYPTTPPRTRADLPSTGPGAIASGLARGVALAVDLILLGLILSATVLSGDVHTKGKTQTLNVPVSHAIIVWAVTAVYLGLFVMLRGTTIGGALMGVKVVRYLDGAAVPPYQAFVRAVIATLPELISIAVPSSVGAYIGFLQLAVWLSIFFDPLLRSIYDKAAGTIVLRTR